jgi:potassium-transporting ATPase ATP-binding subunit
MKKKRALLSGQIIWGALKDSICKMNPRWQVKNPVMFLTYMGAIICSLLAIANGINASFSSFEIQITIWLFLTVFFANFSEALAEGRGKAQTEFLRKTRTQTIARRLVNNAEERINASLLHKGDLVVCEAGDVIPGDGDVIQGIASVDESAITGESAPVIRESGGDRCAVTGGTKVLSDKIVIRITADEGHSFLDKMIRLIEASKRQKTPNEIALFILLVGLTIIFLIVVLTLKGFADYSFKAAGQDGSLITIPVLISLLVCLIPTTIGGLLNAIGISGMDRLVRKNVIASSGRAVEAAGDIDVLLLDKTGTITVGNRMAKEFIPAPGVDRSYLIEVAQLSSSSDETPEGRSILTLGQELLNNPPNLRQFKDVHFIPFTAKLKMSGIDATLNNGEVLRLRKGALEAIQEYIREQQGYFPSEVKENIEQIARLGGTPLVVTKDNEVLGTIYLKDVVKKGIKERFLELRKMGIKTIMITGDNPLTAAAIAAESGVDDFIAEATPEAKLLRIREEQSQGHLVAMTGDGTNDAPALAQADVGVVMNTGTQAAREAGNMVDLDSDPTKLIEIVETGKQILMTRGSLTTFSIANDVAKYFAIIPAIFAGLYATGVTLGPLSKLNIMHLASPQSAILSSVIFNALIIIALVPLALRGVAYRPREANVILRENIFIYGLGGLLSPFFGIKMIDMLIHAGGLL